MNNLPAMTEAQRQELIDFMQGSRTYRYEEWSRLSKLRDQITLAALTVEPVEWMVKYGGIDKEMFVDKQAAARLYHDVTENGFLDVAMLQLYIAPPAPVLRLPDGWKLVPMVPTEAMIMAAQDSEDVLFDKDDDSLFIVDHKEIYRAMLENAPEASNEQC